jgi:hypothetical protein
MFQMVESQDRDRAADFAALYPPYTWIPAFAGMTEYGACRGAEPIRVQASRFEEVQEKTPAGGLGVSPIFFFSPPKIGGSRGLTEHHEVALGCRRFVESRFCGNDNRSLRTRG